jgi:hypothetical protein
MSGTETLQRILEEKAAEAPDGIGLLDQARAGADRIRRRRRAMLGAAALVVLAAIVPAAVGPADRPSPTTGLPATAGPPSVIWPPYRGSLQMTLDLAPGKDYLKLFYGVYGPVQYITVRETSGKVKENWSGDIAVFDPGTFDATHLMRGERITVADHPGYYVPDLLVGTHGGYLPGMPDGREVRLPAVGWQDASGAWVLVFQNQASQDRDTLLRIAQVVRLGQPRDIRAPYRLAYVPAGLPGVYAQTAVHIGDQSSTIEFGTLPTPDPMDASDSIERDTALRVDVFPRHEYLDSSTRDLGPPMKIAGHDGWYLTRSTGNLSVDPGSSLLILYAGRCHVRIGVRDVKQIPFRELKRMVQGARFTDCADSATWTSPLR